ncbi:hypothetical protein [Pseudomonas baetica]|uniref:hypothetical protein n=1 Tax=Pseudomonas baetica TaxID=674054 RepID=UPI0024059828|nr:hypothetical protein [Pseudomonas baetica]MDF9779085.1 hypothetical protein [Pseudomonas baetica]
MTPEEIQGLRDKASNAGDLPVPLSAHELNALLNVASAAINPHQVVIDQETAHECLEVLGPAPFGLRKRLAEKLQAGIAQSEHLAPGQKLISAAIPAELHPLTQELVSGFMAAFAEKLYASEMKRGGATVWANSGWMDQCREELVRQVQKGDVRDIAAYCAFLWYHNERSALTEAELAWMEPLGYLAIHEGKAASSLYDEAQAQHAMEAENPPAFLQRVFVFPPVPAPQNPQ